MYIYNLMKVCSSMMSCLMRNGIHTPTMKKKYIVIMMFQAQIKKKAFISSHLWYFWKIKMLKFYLDVNTILYAFLSSTLVDFYISVYIYIYIYFFRLKFRMPWAIDDVEGRYISLQAWLYIFLKNVLLFDSYLRQ